MLTLKNGLTITSLFLTTLAVWPALVTELKPFAFPSLGESGWWPLILLNVFAVLDVVGRFMVGYRMGVTRHNIWIPVALRTLFIPLLVVSVKGWFFQHDAWSLVFVSILGWTNGWCGSLTIILMNECVTRDRERRFVGTLASFFLNFGLVLGASVGLLVEQLVL